MAIFWVNDRSTMELDLRRSLRANQSWRLRSFALADQRPSRPGAADRGCMKTGARAIPGSSTVGEIEKIDPAAIWRVFLSLKQALAESHGPAISCHSRRQDDQRGTRDPIELRHALTAILKTQKPATQRPRALLSIALCLKDNAKRRRRSHRVTQITSSARSSIDGGTVRPSAAAVLRFTDDLKIVGISTGKSPGLAPPRMRCT